MGGSDLTTDDEIPRPHEAPPVPEAAEQPDALRRAAPAARWRAVPAAPSASLPRIERSTRRVWVVLGGVTIADTRRALRVLEKDRAPVYYIPDADVRPEYLFPSGLHTWSASKGMASYVDAKVGDRLVHEAGWRYPAPAPGCEALACHLAFFPGKMDACYVDGVRVHSRRGDVSGAWVTGETETPRLPRMRGW